MPDPHSVAVPTAPLAAGDPTRRFAVQCDERQLFAGLTRPEADHVAQMLVGMPSQDHDLLLVPVQLDVVLSDGAGPHLLDAVGDLVLVLGPHAHISGAWVAMGAATPTHAVGAVVRVGDLWRWLACMRVGDAQRVAALDALDACTDEPAVIAWQRCGGDMPTTLAE